MTRPQLRTKAQTSISRKICCLKSGFQILYAVEQFSSLFSTDELKQGAQIHQHQQLMICLPRVCRRRTAERFPHVLCGAGTQRTRLGRKGSSKNGFSRSLTDGYAMLMRPSKVKTAVHGYHRPRDMAVRMGEVMARP